MAGAPDPMKWKKYFGQFGSDVENDREIQTYDNMQAEYAGIKGVPIKYYTINVDQYKDGLDPIYGENSSPVWDRSFEFPALIENWSQELQRFTTFELENIDEMVMYIHRTTFDRLVGWRSGETPIQAPNLTPRPNRRGGYGPISKDIICTTRNGLYYEVITGGLHFLETNAQHFGYKFWYKLTLKSREASPPTIGVGEKYGLQSSTPTLEEIAVSKGLPSNYYSSNPQYIVPTPDCNDITAPFTDPSIQTMPTSSQPTDACGRVEYVTIGGPEGPTQPNTLPDDYYLPDGRVANKYRVDGPLPASTTSNSKDVQKSADQVVDPQSDLNVYQNLPSGRVGVLNEFGIPVYQDNGEIIPTNSEDYRNFIGYNKYGPTGRVIRHKRDLWGDW